MFLILFLLYADFGIVAFQLNDLSSPYMKDIDVELEDVFKEQKEGWNNFYDYLHIKVKTRSDFCYLLFYL